MGRGSTKPQESVKLMNYAVKFVTKAQIELLDAAKWYDKQLAGLGDRFEFSVKIKINSIRKNPLIYPNKESDFRECKVDDFPYLIVYTINSEKKQVIISSIFHTSRWPGKKYGKL